MEIKLIEINNAQVALKELAALGKTPAAAYKLMRWLQQEIEPNLKLIEAQRDALITKYGEKSGAGVSIDPKNTTAMEQFIKEWSEYLSTEVTVKPLPMTMDEFVEAVSVKDAQGKDVNTINETLLFSVEKFTEIEKAKK